MSNVAPGHCHTLCPELETGNAEGDQFTRVYFIRTGLHIQYCNIWLASTALQCLLICATVRG